jgi:hypothetical protein
MRKSEKNALLKWAKTLTDEDLEKEYYNSVYDCLGSEAEEMYERGYDIRDIKEREQYEKYLGEKSDILEALCEERGIELWREEVSE